MLAAALLVPAAPVLAGAAGPESVETGCPEDAAQRTAERVQTRYDGIRDLEADFEQRSESATFGGDALMDPAPKTGRVVFAKPGRMRWTYLEPEPSLVVSDGQDLWIHDIEGGTATRLTVTEGYLTGAALQFLLGDGRILESFRVRAVDCQAGRVELELLPRQEASYERLGLVADPETGDISSSTVVDLFGNRTEIRFREMRVNRSPSAEVFEFEPPEGVDVIDYPGGAGPRGAGGPSKGSGGPSAREDGATAAGGAAGGSRRGAGAS